MKIINIIDKATGLTSTLDVHAKLLNAGYQLVGETRVDQYMCFMNETSVYGIWTSPITAISETESGTEIETQNSIYIFEKE